MASSPWPCLCQIRTAIPKTVSPCYPRLKKAMALQTGPPGIEARAVMHASARWQSVIPVPAGIQSLSESGPNSAQKDSLEPPKCTGIAFKHARTVHWWCVSKTPRHPTRQATSVRTASFPRTRDPSCSQKAPKFGAEGGPSAPRNAPGLHANMHETRTGGALVVRFEDFTAPYKTANQRWYWGIPAQAGIHRLSETGPNLAQTDARVHPECTGSAFKHASNTHLWCVSKAPRRPANQPTKESCGRCSDAPTSSLRRMTLSSSLVNDGTRRGRSPVICSG